MVLSVVVLSRCVFVTLLSDKQNQAALCGSEKSIKAAFTASLQPNPL